MTQETIYKDFDSSDTLEACKKNLILLRDLMAGTVTTVSTSDPIKVINADGTLGGDITADVTSAPISAPTDSAAYYTDGNISQIMLGIKRALPFATGDVHLHNHLEKVLHALNLIGFQSAASA